MQFDEQKCRKCDGMVVGRDAIAAMINGTCAHCQNRGRRKKAKTEEEKRLAASHRAATLANRRMKNQQRKSKGR